MDCLEGLCVNRSHPKDEGPLLDALLPRPDAPPSKDGQEPAVAAKSQANMKKKLKVADFILAGVGLWFGCAFLGFCQDKFKVTLFAPPMMASGIIFFVGPAPPSPKPFLFGTLGSATLALGTQLVVRDILPPIAASGSAAAMLLMWYKTTNVLFPPAIVLTGSLMLAYTGTAATATDGDEHPQLLAILHFIVFPWLAGHAWLYLCAMVMSKIRGRARISLAASAFKIDASVTNEDLKRVFKKYDTSGDGALDAEELKIALKVAIGIELSVADCTAMIAQYDKDGTDTVDFNEFIMICRQ